MNKHNLELYKEFPQEIADIIYAKYIWKNKEGLPIDKSWKDIVSRIVRTAEPYSTIMKNVDIARLEAMLLNKYFIPGGSIIAGMGTDMLTSLSNCFVIPGPKDNYQSIINTDNIQVQIMKRRGGVGHDLTKLRAAGTPVNNSAITTSGVVSFIPRYSNSTLEVGQDGRRGALMLSISDKHKDALAFVNSKRDRTSIRGANISVRLTKGPKKGKLLDAICKNMHEFAEPGVLFWDNVLNNPVDAMGLKRFKTVSSNPCGEIPLNEWGSCILAHLNLFAYVEKPFTLEAKFNKKQFAYDVGIAIRFLNVVIEEELAHIIKIMDVCEIGLELNTWSSIYDILKEGRRIGLGITGYADALAALGLPYSNDEETVNFTHTLAKIKKEESYKVTCNINIVAPVLEDDYIYEKWISQGTYGENSNRPANIALSTIAPVGTGSMILGVTSGIEPLFAPIYKRRRRTFGEKKFTEEVNGEKWIELNVTHPPLIKVLEQMPIDIEVIQAFDESAYKGSTTMDVKVEDKMLLQAVWQEYTDQAISVTHNVPSDYPIEKVAGLLKTAYKYGLKGFTMYRDGSREGVLNLVTDTKKKRPKAIRCDIHSVKISGEDWTVLVGFNDDLPYELFALKVQSVKINQMPNASLVKYTKKGNTKYKLQTDAIVIDDLTSLYTSGNEEILTRMITRRWRNGETMDDVLDDFEKVNMIIGTFEQVILRVLSKYASPKEIECPKCGAKLIQQGGCSECSCGYSKCF